ncbi:chromatin remodelling complex Rsc7/Swp82 subunit-domain-containing protein [Elsinoe ampelina]|uniref:Chromatin remodelling complex Rsc7/Swp82 subunit-domain-containing protein n=1 Tax=Elsinoe ampelina TaxID=302913 RepID=A0A6A6GIT6_9PEZI|nr:chromatin remodelling complex Rsc7/Swp82 subunit-domain-containing protein [Elsinoe ampelina]
MVDVDPAEEDVASLPNGDSAAPSPAPEEEEEDATSPKQDEFEEAEPSSPVIQSIPRKRRGPGRPPRNPRPDFDSPGPDDDASDSGTPRRGRRGSGRPTTTGRGGFRGRAKWQKKLEPERVPIDKAGNTVMVVNDEADLPEDEDGEKKVDKDGNLLGGREYRVRVFTIVGREQRLYMLSTEPARCTGFRDSYLFFNKHLSLHKIVLNDEEKMDLIERDLIPHSYKGRNIGICTARSVFREFGARIVIGGKKVIDDYYEEAARERGDVEGELADPTDRLPPEGEAYNKNQYVAWHGASQVYHTQPQSNTIPTGNKAQGKQRKVNLTEGNWQLEHAREASKFNTHLATLRRSTLPGLYDIHTNLLLAPKITQPTHAKWTPSPSVSASIPSPFPPLPPSLLHTHLTVDTLFTPPPHLGLGIPGPDGDAVDVRANGLTGVAREVADELPLDMRGAFEEAVRAEREWKGRWRGEGEDGLRGQLGIGYAGFPV